MDNREQLPKLQQSTQPVKQESAAKKPNEQVGFYFSSSLRISDPETGQVLVQMRADT